MNKQELVQLIKENFTNSEGNIDISNLDFGDFYIKGYIDSISNDFKHLTDYKTGGINKEEKYLNDDYNQLQIYCLSIMQEYGIKPDLATVEYIYRGGNPYKKEIYYKVFIPFNITLIFKPYHQSCYWCKFVSHY